MSGNSRLSASFPPEMPESERTLLRDEFRSHFKLEIASAGNTIDLRELTDEQHGLIWALMLRRGLVDIV